MKTVLRKREEKYKAIYAMCLQQNAPKCYQRLNSRHLPAKLEEKKKLPLEIMPLP